MFDFCGVLAYTLEGLSAIGCYFAFQWALTMIPIVALTFAIIAGYIFWKKKRSKEGFCNLLGQFNASLIKNTFCQHLTSSSLINSICFYFLILASLFAVSLTRITSAFDFSNGNPNQDFSNTANIVSNFFRMTYLFLIFVALEVISLRSYHIKKNKLNLLSSAIEFSERKAVSRLILKKAFIISSILFVSELVPYTINLDTVQKGNNKLSSILKFLESALVLFRGIPKLRVLNYERLLMEQSKYISHIAHRDALIQKHLEDI